MVKRYWGTAQQELLIDLFRRTPPIIDPNNLPSGHELKRFIEDYKPFNIFGDNKRAFYQGVKRYAASFRDDQVATAKGNKRFGKVKMNNL